MGKIKPVFIGLYDYSHLGLRYLSSRLKAAGYEPELLFLSGFTGHRTREPEAGEYRLLLAKVQAMKPDLIGLSVMCSLYLPVAIALTRMLQEKTGKKVVWGGVHPTLFPEESLAYADFVFRGESEEAVLEFCERLSQGKNFQNLQNLCFLQDGRPVLNPLRPLRQDLDSLPFPDVGPGNKYYIARNRLVEGDPLSRSYTYELLGSRGCPYCCSFCCNAALRDLYRGKGKYLRLRSVENILAEIAHVREKMPRLRLLRFWDEIFPVRREWVEEFTIRYPREIGLPFEIWGHPQHLQETNIKKLVAAGLQKIVVGIQSGSPYVRKEIYNRHETQERILEGSRILADAGVPVVVYNFIFNHPWETAEDLQETLALCRSLKKPFRLQLHGLSLLPGTAIRRMTVGKGARTREEIDREFRRPLTEQYQDIHWWRRGRGVGGETWKSYWYCLIYFTQFRLGTVIIDWALKYKNNPEKIIKPLLILQKLFNHYLFWQLGTGKLKILAGGKKRRRARHGGAGKFIPVR